MHIPRSLSDEGIFNGHVILVAVENPTPPPRAGAVPSQASCPQSRGPVHDDLCSRLEPPAPSSATILPCSRTSFQGFSTALTPLTRPVALQATWHHPRKLVHCTMICGPALNTSTSALSCSRTRFRPLSTPTPPVCLQATWRHPREPVLGLVPLPPTTAQVSSVRRAPLTTSRPCWKVGEEGGD